MKKKIAIPLEGNVLSAHFGRCQAFAFVEVENNEIKNITVLNPPEHQPGTFPRFVAAHGATDVIGGGMGPQAISLFNEAGVNVFIGAPVDTPENLVNAFLNGTLQLSANYCDHDGHDHEHGHHHH
ncbi:MAG: NifB/NifX family molybdenum-iron cluster-binding protein [Desulfurella sp.]